MGDVTDVDGEAWDAWLPVFGMKADGPFTLRHDRTRNLYERDRPPGWYVYCPSNFPDCFLEAGPFATETAARDGLVRMLSVKAKDRTATAENGDAA